MKVAIVGGGISGLVAAYLLHKKHQITLFEAASHIGGHTNTVDIIRGDREYAIDTGFIVYNEKTYPLFTRLLARLGVETQPSEMSFSVACERDGVEYGGTSLNTLFAQRRNLIRPRFWQMVRDIFRFYKNAKEYLKKDEPDKLTLGDVIREGRYSQSFVEWHLIPMGSAVWSAKPAAMLEFPARMFCRFFENHGFLDLTNRPQWRVVKGGSREYVRKLTAPFRDQVRTNSPVQSVKRSERAVEVHSEKNGAESFDEIIMACHSDQALALLEDPTRQEREILGAMRYQKNEVVLHTDRSLMPRSRRAWSAWNYHRLREEGDCATLSYNMNILQNLDAADQFIVTLNNTERIIEECILRRFTYSHPIYDIPGLAAQGRWAEISGRSRTHFCGAYWANGFHEDGVRSGVRVAEALGVSAPF